MIKALVIFESKYGNTRKAAEAIVEGMCGIDEIKVVLTDISELDYDHIDWYDLIVMGSPNHIGGPTRGIKKLIDKLDKLDLDEKKGAFFDTCFYKDRRKAVAKMENQLLKKVPQIKLLLSGPSFYVDGLKGPLTSGELEKCRAYGEEIIMCMDGHKSGNIND